MNLGSFNDGCGKIDSELKGLGFEKKIEEKVCKVVGYLNAKLLRKRATNLGEIEARNRNFSGWFSSRVRELVSWTEV
jgi:hypothetical protein